MENIAQNLMALRSRIETACLRNGRTPSEVQLVAVTKNVMTPQIQEAINAGIRDFGENYIQQARLKPAMFSPDIRWHFIGHLQSNKAKYIPGLFHLVHGIDTVALAVEMDRRARQKEIRQKILLEVKLDPSITKNGILPAELPVLTDSVLGLPNLQLLGLMGMAPAASNPDFARPHFAQLRDLSAKLPPENRAVLSMGMSGDFEAAIAEGSTMIRIGTAIFGHGA